MTFAQPLWFAALVVVPVLWLLRAKGYLGFSSNRLLASNSLALKLVSLIPVLSGSAAVILVVVALAAPQVPGEPEHRTTPGRDIVLAVDISFSMSFEFAGELPEYETPEELDFKVPFNERRKNEKGLRFLQPDPEEGLQRIHASQNALLRFIENRWRRNTGYRIGLILFDDRPRYGWPITDDLRMLYRKAQFISTNLGTGTNFGKIPPGPIDLAVQHFAESGQAKSKVLIMVTDGEDDIMPHTQRRLADLLRYNGIRLYLVGIGETLAAEDVDIIKLSEAVGGRVFRVEDTNSLAECFAKIDSLEKSEVTVSQLETRDDIFFYFAWAALACLVVFFVSEVIVVSR